MSISNELIIKLKADRDKHAASLNSSCLAGGKDIITDLYDEDAHFIYELIQNSDDAHAKHAVLILCKSGVYFLHDGNKNFSISDPCTEVDDKRQGKLGDLNAILAIGNSNKNYDGNKIGKFGCGFKSVFKYTDTPVIMNKDLNITIVDYISFKICTDLEIKNYSEEIHNQVLQLEDYQLNISDFSTIFYLPFREEEYEKSYNEISNKVKMLETPVLFLQHLSCFDIIEGNQICEYKKIETFQGVIDDIELTKIKYTSPENTQEYCKVSRDESEFKKYSVLFKLDKEKSTIIPVDDNEKFLFCYFSTRTRFDAPFIINGSFEMNPARTNLKQNDRNESLKNRIKKLAVEALPILSHHKMYHDDIIVFFRYFISEYSLSSIFSEIISSKSVIPCDLNSYTSVPHAMFLEQQYRELFNIDELKAIYNNPDIKLVFPSISKTKYKENLYNNNCFKNILIDGKDIAQKITSEFMQEKFDNHIDFIEKFYTAIYENTSEYQVFFDAPIFLTEKGNWLSRNISDIYLNGNKDSEYECLNRGLFNISDKITNILKEWFKEFDWKEALKVDIRKFENKEISENVLFNLLVVRMPDILSEEDKIFIEKTFSKVNFIKTMNDSFGAPKNLINFKNEFWNDFYPKYWIIDKNFYDDFICNSGIDRMDEIDYKKRIENVFAILLKEREYITVCLDFSADYSHARVYKTIDPLRVGYGRWPRYEKFYDYSIKGVYELIREIELSNDNEDKLNNSLQLFKLIKYFLINEPTKLSEIMYSRTSYGCYYGQQNLKGPALLTMLDLFYNKKCENIKLYNGRHYLSEFHEIYEIGKLSPSQIKELCNFLHVFDDHDKLSLSDKVLVKFADKGVSIDEVSGTVNEILEVASDNPQLLAKIKLLLEKCKDIDDKQLDDLINTVNADNADNFSGNGLNLNLTSTYSNERSLSSAERKRYNEEVNMGRGIQFLEKEGYDLSSSKTERNIIYNVLSPDGLSRNICIKSSTGSNFHLGSHEINAMNKDFTKFVILLHYKYKQHMINCDMLWRKNEFFSVRCKTKDYDDSDLKSFMSPV